MRKIEKEIIKAIHEKKTVNLSERDRVEFSKNGNYSTVILWNSEILYLYFEGEKISKIHFSFRGYSTNTTRNRINAIVSEFAYPCSFSIHNFTPIFYNGKEAQKISSSDLYELNIKDFSLVNLTEKFAKGIRVLVHKRGL